MGIGRGERLGGLPRRCPRCPVGGAGSRPSLVPSGAPMAVPGPGHGVLPVAPSPTHEGPGYGHGRSADGDAGGPRRSDPGPFLRRDARQYAPGPLRRLPGPRGGAGEGGGAEALGLRPAASVRGACAGEDRERRDHRDGAQGGGGPRSPGNGRDPRRPLAPGGLPRGVPGDRLLPAVHLGMARGGRRHPPEAVGGAGAPYRSSQREGAA